MSIQTTEIESDFDELLAVLATSQSVDAQLKRRIRQRSEQLREERLKALGPLDVAVNLIRDVREE